MSTRPVSALLLSIALILSACSSSMNTPDIKQNPHPRQRYELTVVINNAPGSFDEITAGAGYRVSNVECVPYHSLAGVHAPIPNAGQDFVLTHKDDGTWKGYFYLDQMQDEDYFAIGACHWKLESVGANFTFHGQSFGTALGLNDVLAGQPLSKYFKKKDYFNRDISNSNAGAALEWRATDADVVEHPEEYFFITLTAKEARP